MVIKDINFLPENMQENELKAAKAFLVGGVSALVLILLLLLAVGPKIVYKYYDVKRTQQREDLRKLSDIQKKVTQLEEINSNSNKKSQALVTINDAQIKVIDTISKISLGIPASVELKSYNITKDNVSLSFGVDTPLETIELLKGLENLNMFEKVDINSLSIADKAENLNFTLIFKKVK